METIFKNSNIGSIYAPIAGDTDTYGGRIRDLIADAVDFEESYLAREREDNQAYYNGLKPALDTAEEGEESEPVNRSTFVSTDVRDTILTVLPSLVRIFTNQDEKVAELVPNTEEQVPMAEQCYDYLNYVFYEDNPGFQILYAVLKDLMTVKAGITKWWTDRDVEVQERTFHGLSHEQLQQLVYEDPELEILELDRDPITGRYSKTVLRYTKNKPITKLAAVPPDEFRIARDAKDIESAGLVGHERVVPLSELVSKGYDPEDLEEFKSTQISYSDERYMRNPGLVDDHEIDGINYGEWYIRIDADGDGIAELRHICTVGYNYVVISDEVVPYSNFGLWSGDLKSHTAIGDCLADITKDIQRFKTNMMRGQLDNLAESLNPRSVVNELTTNLEDVLNDEVGAVIRTRGNPNEAVVYTKTPYAGAEVQVTVDYLDKVRASRTGITEASKGLDPKAMQSTALAGIDAIVTGAQERIELMARCIAETGLKTTLKGLLREIVDNPNPERVVQLRGEFVNVNPSLFDPTMRVRINPTLGKGTDLIKYQALSMVKADQAMIMEKFGVDNPVCGAEEYRNTIVDILKIANIRNVSRYFKPITPEIKAAIQNAPKEPAPEMVLAQAEMEKVKAGVLKAMGEIDLDKRKQLFDELTAKMDDDFKRDKLNIDAILKLLDITMDPKPQTETGGDVSQSQLLGLNSPAPQG